MPKFNKLSGYDNKINVNTTTLNSYWFVEFGNFCDKSEKMWKDFKKLSWSDKLAFFESYVKFFERRLKKFDDV